jgi:hypothetical protein
MENITGEKEVMAWKKNADGISQYHYKKCSSKTWTVQNDWFIDRGYKRGHFPPGFFKRVEEELSYGMRGYWALAMDGDGCITFRKRTFVVGIGLKDREPVQRLADLYGCKIVFVEYPEEKWKPTYKVVMYGKRALHFLSLICPFMIEKRKEATRLINLVDRNYHPPKISMDFKKNPSLLHSHIGMVTGFFDTEGSVGIRPRCEKRKTKTKGIKVYNSLNQWIHFTNTNLRPLRKIKKILESWPFIFKPKIYKDTSKLLNKKGEAQKPSYKLHIPKKQQLLFMAIFAPAMLITRKKKYFEKFKLKKKIFEMCKNEVE